MSCVHNRLSYALSLFLFCILVGCDGSNQKHSPTNFVQAPAKTTYALELQKLNAGIAHGIELAARQASDTLIPLNVVSLYLERARLTGSYDDYAKADALLGSLSAGPPHPPAQCLVRARLHYALHRLKQASAALATCPTTAEVAEVAALRADIALYSGRYREAEAVYRTLVNDVGIPQHYIRLGLLKKWTGSPGEAAALLEAAEKRYHSGSPTMQAWLKLQRGLVALDRGRLDEALAMYRLASDALEGWWLIDEHIAEVLLLSGKTEEAKRLYDSVIERTRSPEFMDALAAIERTQNHHDSAQKWRQQARAIYETRLAAFPEASAGHALDHYLEDQVDAKQALALAKKNFDTRPYGESALALAKAWMLNERADRAVLLIEAQLAKGWDTAEAYWTLGEALRKRGDLVRADWARAEALRRNPLSEKMYAYLPTMTKH